MVYAGVGIAGHYDIFRLSADATINSNLTLASSYDFWPRWSPDGSQFVFESSRNGVIHTCRWIDRSGYHDGAACPGCA